MKKIIGLALVVTFLMTALVGCGTPSGGVGSGGATSPALLS